MHLTNQACETSNLESDAKESDYEESRPKRTAGKPKRYDSESTESYDEGNISLNIMYMYMSEKLNATKCRRNKLIYQYFLIQLFCNFVCTGKTHYNAKVCTHLVLAVEVVWRYNGGN